MSTMKWTKRKPTKPGFYFYVSDNGPVSVFRLWYENGETEPTISRIGFDMDEWLCNFMANFDECENLVFAGPIPEPKDDK